LHFSSLLSDEVLYHDDDIGESARPTWTSSIDGDGGGNDDDADLDAERASPPAQLAMLLALQLPAVHHHPLRQRRSIRKQAVVGGSAILECDIPYPPSAGSFASHASSAIVPSSGATDNSVMIKWHKQGIEVPIFIQLNRLPAHVDANYHDRIRLLDHASGSVEITGIRARDEGWYECSVVFVGRTDDSNPNGTWVYLAVTGE
jgi:hypothetical protein